MVRDEAVDRSVDGPSAELPTRPAERTGAVMLSRSGRLGAFLCLFALGFVCCHKATRATRLPLLNEPTLTVMTYNVNYGRAGDPEALRLLKERPADLVFLQETNLAWQSQLQAQLVSIYPHQFWYDRPRAGGQAVLARRPFTVRQVLPSPTSWFPALRIEAQTPLGEIEVLAVHLHPPITEEGSWLFGYFRTDGARLQEIEKFTAGLGAKLPTLIVGDFNEGTSGAALSYLEAHGFRSALPEFAPEAATWHWPLGSIELTAQLDHVVYDRGLEPLTAAVLRAGHSDHEPVRATFARAARDAVRPPPPPGRALSIGLLPRPQS